MARALGIAVNLCGTPRRLARSPSGSRVPGMTPARPPCALGLDFGTTSVQGGARRHPQRSRARSAVAEYRHGVIEPDAAGVGAAAGRGLGPSASRRLPRSRCWTPSPGPSRRACSTRAQVIGIGIDFTSCTILPIEWRRAVPCACSDAGAPSACVGEALEASRRTAAGQPRSTPRPRRGGKPS